MARTRSRSVGVRRGPRSLKLGDQLSGGHRSSPSLRVWQRPAEPGRHGRRADAENAGRLVAVELDHDAERDHLALAGAEGRERDLERGREPFDEVGLVRLRLGGRLLAPVPSRFGAEPVEGGRAGDPEQPRAGTAAAGIEARPVAEAPSRTSRPRDRRRAGGRGSGRGGSRRRRRGGARPRRRRSAAPSVSLRGRVSVIASMPFYAAGWLSRHTIFVTLCHKDQGRFSRRSGLRASALRAPGALRGRGGQRRRTACDRIS